MTVVVCVKAPGIIMTLQYAVFTFKLIATTVLIILHHQPCEQTNTEQTAQVGVNVDR